MCESVSTGFFENCLRLDVFYKIWEPREAKANVLFVHGHGEHVSRYDKVFTEFAKSGIKVFGFDQVGCGETGKRANDIGGVKGLEQLLHDITVAIAWIHKNGTPLFLMGHSFGGCAVLNYIARGEKRHFIHGAIASAPTIEITKNLLPCVLVQVPAVVLSHFAPWLKVSPGLGKLLLNKCSQPDVSILCRKKEVIEAYKSDPLVSFNSSLIQCKQSETSNKAVKDILLGGQKLLQKDHENITLNNLLIAHGTADAIASYDTSVYLAEKLETLENIAHFEMKPFLGLYHDLMFEPEGDEVTSTYMNWILAHLIKPE